MKKGILLGLVLTLTFVILGLACSQTATVNTNTASDHNNIMMNSNSSVNANGTDRNSMPMNSNSNMSGMTDHSQMTSSPNAASQPFDLQFIDTMSMHHQGAVQMAEVTLKQTTNRELKTFAQKIIDDQKKEISQMKDWRDKWFAGKPAAINMEMSGMSESMRMMAGGGMMKLQTATGKDIDLMFLDMMTPHHQGAVTMAKEALKTAEHAEIKTLAQNIIKAQEAEIKQMAAWKVKWSK